jgi:hypothetical protein
MADPVTNNYGLTLPTVGGDTGTWGGIQNLNIFTPIDTIFGGNQAVTITSADVTLTATQFQNAVFTVTGTLTGNRNLIVPLSPNSTSAAAGGRFVVANNSSGAYTISAKTASSNSGAGVVVPQGFSASLYSDGSNVWYAANGLPAYALASNGNPNGTLAGVAGSVNTNAELAFDYTANNLYVCTTTGVSTGAVWTKPTVVVPRGFDTPVNLSLSAAVATNVLTITVLTADTAANPSVADPVVVQFRDSTLTNGDPVSVSITGALSISTIVGATQGATNSIPFRLWIVLFNNGGTPVLGLINCLTAAQVYALNETGVASSTQMSNTATSAGVFYTPSGTTLASKAFRIIGMVSYETALATAGTYNNPPDVVQLFGPGVKKPGDTVQEIFPKVISGQTAVSGAAPPPTATSITNSITPTSKINAIEVIASVNWSPDASDTAIFQLTRNSTSTYFGNLSYQTGVSGFGGGTDTLIGIDAPAAVTSVTYTVYGGSNGSAFVNANGTSTIKIREIMG